MSDQKKGGSLQSFQIGNLKGGLPGAGPRVPGAANLGNTPLPQGQPNASGLFPHLEELIERSDEELRAFGEAMGVVCQQLDELVSKRSGRVKEEAQRARQAYERTFDMINHLMEIKQQLISEAGKK